MLGQHWQNVIQPQSGAILPAYSKSCIDWTWKWNLAPKVCIPRIAIQQLFHGKQNQVAVVQFNNQSKSSSVSTLIIRSTSLTPRLTFHLLFIVDVAVLFLSEINKSLSSKWVHVPNLCKDMVDYLWVNILGSNPKILIIEDDTEVLHLNKEYLEGQGYEVFGVQTLAQARFHIVEQPPDLILLDVMMPDGIGWDFCADIRKQTNTPIIFLSCRDENESIVRGLVPWRRRLHYKALRFKCAGSTYCGAASQGWYFVSRKNRTCTSCYRSAGWRSDIGWWDDISHPEGNAAVGLLRFVFRPTVKLWGDLPPCMGRKYVWHIKFTRCACGEFT